LLNANLFAARRNRDAMDEDEELIARVRAGDDAALRELVFRHTPWLGARLRAVLSATDVEDVLQETFLAVWRGASGYRRDGEVGGWLWGIARRQAALFLRRRGPADLPAVPVEALVAASGELNGSARVSAHMDTNPEQTALVRAELAEAVLALGPEGSADREVWQLMYVEDRPVDEVARMLGVPPGTVKSRAHRVRRVLRGVLRGDDSGAHAHGRERERGGER
jgi:RNA polymerase sigma-70 factor (ECF subfamily)